jgi:hypothetical protein
MIATAGNTGSLSRNCRAGDSPPAIGLIMLADGIKKQMTTSLCAVRRIGEGATRCDATPA